MMRRTSVPQHNHPRLPYTLLFRYSRPVKTLLARKHQETTQDGSRGPAVGPLVKKLMKTLISDFGVCFV